MLRPRARRSPGHHHPLRVSGSGALDPSITCSCVATRHRTGAGLVATPASFLCHVASRDGRRMGERRAGASS